MRKLNLEMVRQGSLNYIAIEPMLQDSVILAQLHDESIKIIKQKLAQGEENIGDTTFGPVAEGAQRQDRTGTEANAKGERRGCPSSLVFGSEAEDTRRPETQAS